MADCIFTMFLGLVIAFVNVLMWGHLWGLFYMVRRFILAFIDLFRVSDENGNEIVPIKKTYGIAKKDIKVMEAYESEIEWNEREMTPREHIVIGRTILRRKIQKCMSEIEELQNPEFDGLLSVYQSLFETPINSETDLAEVDFIFNEGRLRGERELEAFREECERNKYKEEFFVKDVINISQKVEDNSYTILAFLLFVTPILPLVFLLPEFQYEFYTIKPEGFRYGSDLTSYFLFLVSSAKLMFNVNHVGITYVTFAGACVLCLAPLLFFGSTLGMMNAHSGNAMIRRCYNRAGLKKPVNWNLIAETSIYGLSLYNLMKK